MLLFVIFQQDVISGEEQLEQKRESNELGSGGLRGQTSVGGDVKHDINSYESEAERNGFGGKEGHKEGSGSERDRKSVV